MRFATVLFDLDGTLYEDPAIYARYVRELADRLPPVAQEAFLAEWEELAAGCGPALVGMGYDPASGRLFRYDETGITAWLPWPRRAAPASAAANAPTTLMDDDAIAAATGPAPMDTLPRFDAGHGNLGDHWGLADALAAHYGLARAERSHAFLATRAAMSAPDHTLDPPPGLRAALERLRADGMAVVVMSNSPEPSVLDVLQRLGIRDCFDTVIAQAQKPRGLEALLTAGTLARPLLAIGDNYINDIQPILRAGERAIYIDRHGSNLGRGNPACIHVASIIEALAALGRA